MHCPAQFWLLLSWLLVEVTVVPSTLAGVLVVVKAKKATESARRPPRTSTVTQAPRVALDEDGVAGVVSGEAVCAVIAPR